MAKEKATEQRKAEIETIRTLRQHLTTNRAEFGIQLVEQVVDYGGKFA